LASEDRATNPWMIALAVILPTFMEVLDTSIASVALPYIAGSVSLAHNITPDNPVFQQHYQGLQTMLQQFAGPAFYQPAERALGILDRGLSQQAALLALVDDFRYLAIVCTVCVPLVFVLKKAKAKAGAVSSAH